MSKLERKMVYQSLTYILRIIILSHAVFVGGLMANLYDYVMEKKETLAYCMYYFVVFDHGLSRMAKLLDCLLNSGEVDNGDMILIKSWKWELKAKPDGKMLWKPVIQKYGKK